MRLALVVLMIGVLTAEIVDRIAANVGSHIIAESEVNDQIRVVAFLEGTAPDFSSVNRRRVLDRLIDQTLMRREVEFVRFQMPAAEEIKPLLDQVKERYPDEAAYRVALRDQDITEEQLLAQLTWQLGVLRFIEYRFQPAVEVTNSLVRHEYRQQASAWREKNGTDPPPLSEIRAEIETIVRQRLIDSALDRWLGEVRTQNQIVYHEGYK